MLTRKSRELSIQIATVSVLLVATSTPARADDLLRFGRIATLAALCGIRDEAWSFDLRRAELQSATGSERFDDEALKRAPGSDRAAASLSSAEHEAIEEFAEKSPARTCAGMRAEGDLAPADDIVRTFRAQRERPAGS